jgi:tetratricopeptide (TPR) repeat protein
MSHSSRPRFAEPVQPASASRSGRSFACQARTGLLALLAFGTTSLLAAPADDIREAQRMYQAGRLQPALEKVESALKVVPKDAQGRFLKGLIFTEQRRTQEAIVMFNALTEDFPELPEPYNNLAVLYASQGNYERAKAALELAIHTHPTYATAHENLGDIYAQLASRAYDRALQLDKSNSGALSKLNLVKELFSANRPARPAGSATASAASKASTPVPTASAPPAATVAAPAAPVTAAPTPAAPTAVAAAPAAATAPSATAPATAPSAASASGKADIEATVQAWAKAWAARDVPAYLAFYAPDFNPQDGLSRAEWQKQRDERISRAKSIEVGVTMVRVDITGNEATAVFRQRYRSDITKSDSTKTLRMVKNGDRWQIRSERSGG